jgi:hypothetical protein
MRTTIPDDRCIPLPTIIFRYVPVHNATEPFRWDSETNDKTTAANQHLEQSMRVRQRGVKQLFIWHKWLKSNY